MNKKHLRLVGNEPEHQEKQYVVGCTDIEAENLYWSNDMGWVNLSGATIFSEEEVRTLRLPMDGEWIDLSRLRESMRMHPVNYKKRPELKIISD